MCRFAVELAGPDKTREAIPEVLLAVGGSLSNPLVFADDFAAASLVAH